MRKISIFRLNDVTPKVGISIEVSHAYHNLKFYCSYSEVLPKKDIILITILKLEKSENRY